MIEKPLSRINPIADVNNAIAPQNTKITHKYRKMYAYGLEKNNCAQRDVVLIAKVPVETSGSKDGKVAEQSNKFKNRGITASKPPTQKLVMNLGR